jgi:hypothetical protein
MPRSVYSVVGHDDSSGFNPINLIKRFTAGAIVMAMVLLGTATMASAAALTQPTVTQAGSGAINVQFTPDATATVYTVTSSPGGFSCVVSSASAIPASPLQTCTVSGLTNGTAYTFAVTPSGNGTTSSASPASASITPAAALGVPTVNSLGKDSTGTTDAAWVGFAADGIATSYSVTSAFPNTAGTVAVTLAASTGLTGNTGSYSGSVNPVATAVLTIVSPNTATFTGTPTSVQLTAVNTTAKTFVYSITGGTTPTVTAGTATATSTQNSVGPTATLAQTTPVLTGTQGVDVTGLTTAAVYTFTVTPNDSAVAGVSSAYTAIATLQPAVAVNSAAGSQTVSFYATGMSTTWSISASASSGGTVVGNSCVVTNSTTPPVGPQACVVTGLTNGTAYFYTVTPTINNGEKNVAQVGTSSQGNVSGALTVTAANSGSGAVLVSWTADGHATTYTVNSNTGSPAGTNCVVANTSTPPSGTQSCVVSGLGTNVGYTFTVTPSAYGSYSGSVSTAGTSSSLTTLKALTQPTTSVVSSSSIKVSFTADGTATTYTVTSYSGVNYATAGQTCTVVSTTPITNGTASNCIVTGLSSTVSYEFTVTPSGNGDTNVASILSAAKTPGSSLAAPTVATAGSGAIAVTFIADGVDTQYTATAYFATDTGLTTSRGTCTVANTATPPTGVQTCTISSLTNTTQSYIFGVTATGAATPFGASGASAAITPTNALPTPTVSNNGSGAIKVTFVADGTASTYTVTASTGQTCTVANTSTVPTGTQSCVVTGLTNGVSYTFTVTPTGNSDANIVSASSASITPGVTPLATPTVTFGGTGAAVVAFAADGVASTYTVTSSSTLANAAESTCTVINSSKPPTGAQTCTVSGLTNGDSYTFTVQPSGNATTSLVSAASAPFVVAASSVPAVPTGVTATGGKGTIAITWVAPTNTGGSAITGYTIAAVSGNTTTSCGGAAATATTCNLTGLAAGTYSVTVSAVNANGTGVASAAASATVTAVTPPAPAFKVIKMVGHAVPGKTVVAVIIGAGFYAQPRITSNVGGVRIGVSGDTGTALIIHITTGANVRRGVHTLHITLANGSSASVNYVTR